MSSQYFAVLHLQFAIDYEFPLFLPLFILSALFLYMNVLFITIIFPCMGVDELTLSERTHLLL